MRKLNLCTILLLCLATPSVKAQSDDALPYAFNHTVEYMFGTSQNMKHYDNLMDGGMATAGQGLLGAHAMLRYSYFVDKHYGVWGGMQLTLIRGTYDDLFARVGKELGVDSQAFSKSSCNCWALNTDVGARYFQMAGGLVYRLDFGRVSIRPRVGVGLRLQSGRDHRTSFYYSEEDANSINYYKYNLRATSGRGHKRGHLPSIAYMGSLQVSYNISRRVFLSAEASWTGCLNNVYERCKYTKSSYERVTNAEGEMSLDYDKASVSYSETVSKLNMGNFLDLRIGVGVNIGRHQ